MIVNVYFEDWSAEVLVISFGLIHGLGGASVALNLATISYIGDISTPETKVHLQGDPKQTDIFEIATTLLWVNSGKKSN